MLTIEFMHSCLRTRKKTIVGSKHKKSSTITGFGDILQFQPPIFYPSEHPGETTPKKSISLPAPLGPLLTPIPRQDPQSSHNRQRPWCKGRAMKFTLKRLNENMTTY